MDLYRKHAGYGWLKKTLRRRCGREAAEAVWRRANEELRRLNELPIPPQERFHVRGTILPRAAMYRALQEHVPEDAVSLLDETVAHAGRQMSRLLGGLVRLPGMRGAFLRIFAWMARRMFGESAGFGQVMHRADGQAVRFDITGCPYVRWCGHLGCEAIVHTFCDSDAYCFGSLPGLRFARRETLGAGSEKCDFSLEKGA